MQITVVDFVYSIRFFFGSTILVDRDGISSLIRVRMGSVVFLLTIDFGVKFQLRNSINRVVMCDV